MAIFVVGCTTMQRRPISFAEAVRNSVETAAGRTNIVVVVRSDGALSLGGRPTTVVELEGIRNVSGLPENPPSVTIRADRDARHADVRAVMDALTKAGIWRIKIAAIRMPQNDTPDGIRQPAGGSARQLR